MKILNSSLGRLAVVTTLLAAASQLQAATLISNLPLSPAHQHSTLWTTDWAAVGFTTSSGYTLSSVIIDSTTTSGNPTVSIYSDNAGNPGASIGTLTYASQSGDEKTYTGSTSLAASTTYWVVISGSAAFEQIGRDSFAPYSGDATAAGQRWTGDGGLNWGAGSYYGVQVSGTVVPEPSTYAMIFGMGLAGFAFLRRKLNA